MSGMFKSTRLEGQVTPTLKPLEPIPTIPTPLDLDTPLLEPITFHLGKQLEREELEIVDSKEE